MRAFFEVVVRYAAAPKCSVVAGDVGAVCSAGEPGIEAAAQEVGEVAHPAAPCGQLPIRDDCLAVAGRVVEEEVVETEVAVDERAGRPRQPPMDGIQQIGSSSCVFLGSDK